MDPISKKVLMSCEVVVAPHAEEEGTFVVVGGPRCLSLCRRKKHCLFSDLRSKIVRNSRCSISLPMLRARWLVFGGGGQSFPACLEEQLMACDWRQDAV